MASDVNLNRAKFSLSFEIQPLAPPTTPLSISVICFTSWRLFFMTRSWAALSSFSFSCMAVTGLPLPPSATTSSPDPGSLSSIVCVCVWAWMFDEVKMFTCVCVCVCAWRVCNAVCHPFLIKRQHEPTDYMYVIWLHYSHWPLPTRSALLCCVLEIVGCCFVTKGKLLGVGGHRVGYICNDERGSWANKIVAKILIGVHSTMHLMHHSYSGLATACGSTDCVI